MNDVSDAGSGMIITNAERQKLDSITNVGSGQIITNAERDKLNEIDPDLLMNYRGFYDPVIDPPVQYNENDVVVDGEYLAIATADTTDRPAPVQIGQSAFLLTDPTTDFQIDSKQYVKGNRYTAANNIVLQGFKIKTVIGQLYSVFLVRDPEGAAIFEQLFVFEGTQTGFTEIAIPRVFFNTGEKYDILTLITDADPTTVVTNLNFDYKKESGNPDDGEIKQANGSPGIIRISKEDKDGNDVESFLDELEIGDRISVETTIWIIQSTTEFGSYYEFNVIPATQLVDEGEKIFTFIRVVSSDITYDYNANYWSNESITAQGFEGETLSTLTFNSNGYGIDGLLGDVQFSADWDILSSCSNDGQAATPVAPIDGFAYGLKNGVYVRVQEKQAKCTIFSLETITALSSGAAVVIDGWQILNNYLIDITNDKIQNISDRVIQLSGSISITPDKSGGGTSELSIVTDVSTDGVSWTENNQSLLLLEISGNNESMQTKFSGIILQPGEFGRVRMAVTSGNDVTIYEPTRMIGSETYTGYSCIWELSED